LLAGVKVVIISIRTRILSGVREWSVYFGIVARIFPHVGRELDFWRRQAARIPDSDLAQQAAASIEKKSFHCMGGSVFALLNPSKTKALVKAIVAIQTISDYLDNLCDRVELDRGGAFATDNAARNFSAFMRLHEAMLCAVDPLRPTCDYYSLYPMGNDGGYLDALVSSSREVISSIDDYRYVKPLVVMFAGMYSQLQSIKHLPHHVRDKWMEAWFFQYSGCSGTGISEPVGLPLQEAFCPWPEPGPYSWADFGQDTNTASGQPEHLRRIYLPGQLGNKIRKLKWWEFGAATGSTLGIFSLIAYSSLGIFGASGPEGVIPARGRLIHPPQAATLDCRRAKHSASSIADPTQAHSLALTIAEAYFPAICGLHILLDYFIDQDEDKKFGDLNFVSYYKSPKTAAEALKRFINQALEEASNLPEPWFHKAVVKGLLAMYLSDNKIRACGLSSSAMEFTRCGGGNTEILQAVCRFVRKTLGF
jgi:tetraprenyl-beta-curcumene synthase